MDVTRSSYCIVGFCLFGFNLNMLELVASKYIYAAQICMKLLFFLKFDENIES